MRYDILVVGAGHGGLVAAVNLARRGFRVAVFEQQAAESLGYDWHDDLRRDVFSRVGLPAPSPNEYFLKKNITFVSPDLHTSIPTYVAEPEIEISMERRLILRRLIAAAEDAGAEIRYRTAVTGPAIRDNRIYGICTGHDTIAGNVIIDSAGINTPIRPRLPASYCMPVQLCRGEIFYTYRAYFECDVSRVPDPAVFWTYIGFGGQRGIAWYRIMDGRADVLLGKIDPFLPGEVDALLAQLRQRHPSLGMQRVRGGQYLTIPLRRPFTSLVGYNYAVVGDAACMTVPIHGSGIENAMVAGKLLADAIEEAHLDSGPQTASQGEATYSPEALWPYQVRFFLDIGAKMAGIDYLKCFLFTVPWADLNFILAKGLIAAKDFEGALKGNQVKLSVPDLVGRFARGITRLPLLLKLKSTIDQVASVQKAAETIPSTFDPAKISEWRQRIDRLFRPLQTQLSL